MKFKNRSPLSHFSLSFFSLLTWHLSLVACLFLFLSCSDSSKNYAPDFTLPLLQKPTQAITLSEVSRHASVLLVFWATWCPECTDEIPKLNDLHKEYFESNKLRILSVNVGETREEVNAFLNEYPIDYPVLLDLEEDVAGTYGLSSVPAVVLLAKSGEIRYYGFTLPSNLRQYLQD